MSVLERCPSHRESNKGSKARQGPTLGVRLIEVSVKRESTVTGSGIIVLFKKRLGQTDSRLFKHILFKSVVDSRC